MLGKKIKAQVEIYKKSFIKVSLLILIQSILHTHFKIGKSHENIQAVF